MDLISIIALIIAIIALIIAIIAIVWFNSHKTSITNNGLALNVKQGVASGATDTMTTGGNNLYIVNSASPLTLSIAPDDNNVVGSLIQIFNDTANTTTLTAASPLSLDTTTIGSTTVAPGGLAEFVFTGSNTFLRIK